MHIRFKIEIGDSFFDYNVGGPGVLVRLRGKEYWLGRDETGRMQVVRG